MPHRELTLAVPGELTTRTGGYIYDHRAFAALAARGWRVAHLGLSPCFPFPDRGALDGADVALAGLPERRTVVIDGLALGAMPEQAARHGRRLDLVGLVHHPLCLETGLDPGTAARLRASEGRALAHARRVIVTSVSTARAVAAELGVPPGRISVAPPGIDRAPPATGGGASPSLICVGTLTPRKGHLLLLEALTLVRDLPWRLTCVGSLERDPATARAVRAAVHHYGLAERVSLAGELAGEALAAVFAAADIAVSASFYEGYGMALAEALARGLPVVATAGGAVAATVPADAGLLVPPGDPLALAAALRRALTEPTVRAALRAGALRARERLPLWEDTAGLIEAALLATRVAAA